MKKLRIVTIILMLCLVITGCGKEKVKTETVKEDTKSKIITNEGVIKEQTVDGLKFSNISMIANDGITTFKAKVTNTTNSEIKVEKVKIIVKDKDNKVLATLTGYVGGVIKANDISEINNTTDIDLSKASSIEYQLEK